MNLQQQEKLQKLINNSPILGAMERAEWRALLGVMNDKQLAELERILTPVQPKVATTQLPKPQEPAVKLSHIVNMPHPSPGVAEPKSQNAQQAFSQKLHSILEEKELSSPATQKDLPKAAENQKANAVIIQPIIVQKETKIFPPVAPKPVTPKENPPPQFKTVTPPSFGNHVAAQAVSSDYQKSNQTIGNILQKKEEKKPEFIGGIKLGGTSPKVQAETLSSIKEHLEQRQNNFNTSTNLPKRPLGPEPKISSLEDLAVLKPSILQDSDLGSLTNKIRVLIAHYGYYPVVFNIEKSPVYKTYIQTGQNVLNSGADFSRQDGLEKSLSREEFEKMTDLLRGIQVN